MGDADITLRHVTRRRAEELARAFVAEDHPITVVGWVDSQVTKIERRLDKAMRLRVGGEPRVLHVELYLTMTSEVPDKILDYLGFLFTAPRSEVPGKPVPPIESVAVILSGPRKRLPEIGMRCTAWPGRRFSGTHFRIDAVYQRTVAELRARGSVLWLVFTPLARDASVETLREVLREIHAGAMNHEEREELLTAFMVMASIDPWGHHLEREVTMMVEELDLDWEIRMLLRLPGVPEKFARALRIVQQKAEQRGEQEAEQRGEQETVAALLGRLFARRVGRRPTAEEERSIVERAAAIGPVEVEDALLDLDADAVVRWLAEPVRRP